MSGLEGLDDDHAPAAGGTGLCEALPLLVILIGAGFGFVLLRLDAEQLSHPRQVLGAGAVGEEALMADAMETLRQDVEEEAADELVGIERHDLLPVAAFGPVVLPPEGDAFVVV